MKIGCFPSNNSGARKNLPGSGRQGFTLVELLVAIAVLALLMVVLFEVLGTASKAWSSGNQRSQMYQSARAVIEMIGREVSEAEPVAAQSEVNAQYASSPLVINPPLNLPASVKLLQDKSGITQDTLFFYAPLKNTKSGPLVCVGYYVTSNYQLQRLAVAADNLDYTSTTLSCMAAASLQPYYMLSAAGTGGILGRDEKLNKLITPVGWLNNSSAAFGDTKVVSALADQVIGFVVRPIGRDGNPLPSSILPSTAPVYTTGSYNTGSIASRNFNSAWFPVADKLPTEIEVTLILCESRAFTQLTSQGATLPVLTMPTDNSDTKLQDALDALKTDLAAAKVKQYVILTKRFALIRGSR